MQFPLRGLLLTTVSGTDTRPMAPVWQLWCFPIRPASKPEACTKWTETSIQFLAPSSI